MSKLYNDPIEVSHDQEGGPWPLSGAATSTWSQATLLRSSRSATVISRRLGSLIDTEWETKLGLICELLKNLDGVWSLERVWD